MNVYSLLLNNAEARISAMPWGGSVITTVNLNLPAERQVPVEVTGKQLSEIIFELDPLKRRAIFDMDVFIGETEVNEQVERVQNSRLILVVKVVMLIMAFLLVAFYVITTARSGTTSQDTLTTLFNFVGELLKIIQGTNSPGSE